MTTTYTRPTWLPKRSPVIALHVCADNDVNGNPRRCYVVLDAASGRHVETIDEGYQGHMALARRFPWFNAYSTGRLELEQSYEQMISVSPAEYQRWMRREPTGDVPAIDRIRRMADRYEREYGHDGRPRKTESGATMLARAFDPSVVDGFGS